MDDDDDNDGGYDPSRSWQNHKNVDSVMIVEDMQAQAFGNQEIIEAATGPVENSNKIPYPWVSRMFHV